MTKKVKVSDLAKELGITPKDLLTSLKDLGVAAKTAASSIEEEAAQVVREIHAPVKPKEENVPPPETITPPKKVEPKIEGPVIDTPDITVKDLADKIAVRPSDLIKELMKKGILATINQRINAEMACDISTSLGKKLTVKTPKKAAEVTLNIDSKNLVTRPPIVTILGHVDHGKTKLLDAIRKTKVAEGEAGGITQHIGASQVEVHGKKVTFLDTPGHEAFTALRARGAKVTDIAVLVVAADDGIMPQTIEAIDHAKAAGVPIIVALNKIDKPDANPDRVKQQLADLGLIPEEWGGKTIVVPTSARQGTGINELLEMILLIAEVQELKADPKGIAAGIIIESRLDKGRGPVADVLIKNGTLKVGDVFTIGSTWGKVRALIKSNGERVNQAGPSTPVEVLGAINVPVAGDILQVENSEKEARLLAEQRQEQASKTLHGKALSLEDFSKQVKEGEIQDLFLIVKADVQGSMDAIVRSIQNLTLENIRINIIHQGVGAVTESDIMLAKASNAVIINFNMPLSGSAEAASVQEGVEVRNYDIIYKLIDDVKLAMEGMLEPEYEEVLVGKAEVRNLFKYSKVGTIAGCFVTEGKLTRGFKMRILRDKQEIYKGKLESLKRFKEDVKAVEQNFECGIAITGYTDFRVGDIIEIFETREKARKK